MLIFAVYYLVSFSCDPKKAIAFQGKWGKLMKFEKSED